MSYRQLPVLAAALLIMAGQILALDLSRQVVLDIPKDAAVRQFGGVPSPKLAPEEMQAMAAYRFAADTFYLLVVPVEWDNRPGTYSPATLDSLVFSLDVYPGGSLADYFFEVSYGRVTIVGEVLDWYNAGMYTWGSEPDYEQVLIDVEPTVDFGAFDGDGNGDVDAVAFIRAGTGQEDTHLAEDTWSYAVIGPPGMGMGPFDGVYVSRWSTNPEKRPTRMELVPTIITGDTLNNIRVMCHELSHDMGLPDLYDYDDKLLESTYYTPNDYNDHPVYDWCLMGYGGYGLFSIKSPIPSHLCGWSKMQLGWLEPIVLEGEHTDLVIYDVETHSDSSLYLLPIIMAEGEYFLLEFRNPYSSGKFDKTDSDFSVYFHPDLTYGADTLDCGLLIMHVHDSLGTYWWRMNNGTPEYDHYSVAVEDAGYNAAHDIYMNPEGYASDTAQWWYPYETRKGALFSSDVPGQEEFSAHSTPSSDGYYDPTGISVRVDSIVGDRLYAYVWDFVPHNERWDTVSTTCLDLVVGQTGNCAHSGVAGYSMDYAGSGDCDPSADSYLYDGSALLCYDDGSGRVVYYSMYFNESFVPAHDVNPPVPTQTTADFDVFESGTFITPDSAVAMEKTWWAPKAPDSCTFIIERLRVFSYDGFVHDGLAIAEVTDWDIPSDAIAMNSGGFDAGRRLLYLRGLETDGLGCQPNDTRYGGLAFLGTAINDAEQTDTTADAYSAYVFDVMEYVYPQTDFVPDQLDALIQNPGYGAVAVESDLSIIMTFFYDYTLNPGDTLYVYTVLTSVQSGSAPEAAGKADAEILANIDRAKRWAANHVLSSGNEVVCGDANGDRVINVGDAVFLINFIFKSGLSPDPMCAGDVNSDAVVNVGDAVYMINHIFKSGSPPQEPCCP